MRVKAVGVMFVCWLIGGLGGPGIFTLAAWLILLAFVPWRWLFNKISENAEEADRRRQQAQNWKIFGSSHRQWAEAMAYLDEAEQRRRNALNLWFPVSLQPRAGRIDVFGGAVSDWAAILTVAGSGFLAAGRRVLVLDLTESDIAGPLIDLTRTREVPIEVQDLPADLEGANLLDGLTSRQIASLIAGMLEDLRGTPDANRRLIDSDLVQMAVDSLDNGAMTFERIVAALSILEQSFETYTCLNATEVERLSRRVADIREERGPELRFVRSALRQLIAAASDKEGPRPHYGVPWSANGLWVIRTNDEDHRQREALDQLLAQVLLMQLRRLQPQEDNGVVVLAGVDKLGLKTLEEIAKAADRAGLTLMLLVEHLRDDMERLMGGANSVTVFMRLRNGREAEVAADHIGKGHRFLLTQITSQKANTVGTTDTVTEGTNSSHADTSGTMRNRTSRHWFEWPTITSGWNRSQTITVGESRQFSRGESRSITTTDGETISRVYDFQVEPTQIQALEPLSFLLVEPAQGGARTVAGSCDPSVALLPRVSATPMLAGEAANRSVTVGSSDGNAQLTSNTARPQSHGAPPWAQGGAGSTKGSTWRPRWDRQ